MPRDTYGHKVQLLRDLSLGLNFVLVLFVVIIAVIVSDTSVNLWRKQGSRDDSNLSYRKYRIMYTSLYRCVPQHNYEELASISGILRILEVADYHEGRRA